MSVTIHFAENDDHGRPSGKCTWITVEDVSGETSLSIQSRTVDEDFVPVGVPMRSGRIGERRVIELMGVCYPYQFRHEWVGNICWNAYVLDEPQAIQILNDLKKSNHFGVEEAWTEIYEKWDAPTVPLAMEDFGWLPETEEADFVDPNQMPLFE